MRGEMEGSLDSPPIILKGDPWKSAGYLILCVLVLAALLFAPYDDRPTTTFDTVLLWLLRSVLSFCVVIGVLRLVHPPVLQLTPSGMTMFTSLRNYQCPWMGIEAFQYSKGSFLARIPSMIFIKPNRDSTQFRLKAIPGGWSIDLPELEKLLNDALARWGGK